MTLVANLVANLVVVGSVNMDLVLRCEHLPLPGQTVHGHDLRSWPGGKGANQAVAAARLGARVAFVGCVGDDAFGSAARVALQAEGLDLAHLHTLPGVATGVAMITVDAAGRNAIALAAGANAQLSVAQVDAAADVIRAASLVVCQLESPLDAVARAVAIAHAAGVPALLNPAPAGPLPAELLAQLDVLAPNESEAALLLGLSPDAPLDAPAAAQALREAGPASVILTLGERGVCVADAAGVRMVPAVRVTPRDTTGAGDTFVGAYAAARCEGLPAEAAIAYAQRAAALAVGREGAMPAMPYRAELITP